MKSIKWARILTLSFLFLAFHVVPPINISTAQEQSTTPNLDGTQWQAHIAWKNTETLATNDFAEYDFGKQRSVKFKYISVAEMSVISVVPKTNPLLPPDDPRAFEGSETKKRSSTVVRNTGGGGTYVQKGTMVHLEFSDHTIDASIKRNIMEGIITIKGTGERGLWDAERVSKTGLKQPENKIDIEQKYKQHLEEGERLQNNKKYREAIEAYTLAINLNVNDRQAIVAFYQRATSRFQLRSYRGTIADYDEFLTLFNREKAAAEKATGITDSQLFVIRHSQDAMVAYYERATSKFELGNYGGAIVDYDQFFSLYDKEEGAAEKAGGITDSLLRGLRYSPDAHYYRGFAKDKLGNRVGACEDFRKSCSLGILTACQYSKSVCN